MAFKTVSNLKDEVAGILSGIDLGNVADLYGAFERAARVFIQKAKIPESTGTQNITLYDGVTDYAIDTRIYGTSLTDIRPQGISRQFNDFVYKKLSDDFDRTKEYLVNGTMATFDYKLGTPVIRIVSTQTTPHAVLDPMTDDTGWTAGGNITDLTTDATDYYQKPASLRFNQSIASTQGTLIKTLNSTDYTTYQGVGVIFLAIKLDSATETTSVGVKFGSDASNYYDVSNTVSTLGAFVAGEFILIPLDLSTATTTGTPDITKITYLQVYINTDGTAQTNVRVGKIFMSLPSPAQILYSSDGIFKVSSTISRDITTDADEIILNSSAYTIYEYECALSVLQQTGGGASDSTMTKIENILNGNGRVLGLYEHYRSENPSEVLRAVGSWYENENNNYF